MSGIVRNRRNAAGVENALLNAKGTGIPKKLNSRAALGEIGNTVENKPLGEEQSKIVKAVVKTKELTVKETVKPVYRSFKPAEKNLKPAEKNFKPAEKNFKPVENQVKPFKKQPEVQFSKNVKVVKPVEKVSKPVDKFPKPVRRVIVKEDTVKEVEKKPEVKKIPQTHLRPLNLKRDWFKPNSDLLNRRSKHVQTIPPGVHNIDSIDPKNIFLLSTYVTDIFIYLKQLETKYSIRYKHLSHLKITGYMRAIMVDWLVDVQVQFHLIPETFQMAVSLLDRYLQDAHDVTGDNFQLVGIGCLLIASKFEETYPPEINDFVFMSNSAFLQGDILEMESKILKVLDFNLGKPVPITFLRRYSRATSAEPVLHSYAKYFIELALLDYKLSSEKPSMIAATSLYTAQRIMFADDEIAPNAIWNATVIHYSGYSLSDFKHLIPRLAYCIQQAAVSKFKALRSKFSTNKYHQVSLNSEIKPDSKILEELINFGSE